MSWKTEKSFTFRKNNLHTVIHTVSKKQTGKKIIRPTIFSACLLFFVTVYFD